MTAANVSGNRKISPKIARQEAQLLETLKILLKNFSLVGRKTAIHREMIRNG